MGQFASVAVSYPDIQFVLPVMGWPIDLTNEGHETWKRGGRFRLSGSKASCAWFCS
jgi:hypothetical protein